MATQHLTRTRQFAVFIAVTILAFTAQPTRAQDNRPPLPDAVPMQVGPPEQAVRGGKYVADDGYLREGVPVPASVEFSEKDDKGNYTFKGVHPPNPSSIRKNFNAFPAGEAQIDTSEFPKPSRSSDPDIQGVGHNFLGLSPIPSICGGCGRGLLMMGSSPIFNMTAIGWHYFFYTANWAGRGCLEEIMVHAKQDVQNDFHAFYDWCTGGSVTDGWNAKEFRTPAWEDEYVRTIYARPNYQALTYTYWASSTGWCSVGQVYSFKTATWHQKIDSCGNPAGDPFGWSMTEVYFLGDAYGNWYCISIPEFRGENIHIVSPITGQWIQASYNDTPLFDSFPGCAPSAYGLMRSTYGGGNGWVVWKR